MLSLVITCPVGTGRSSSVRPCGDATAPAARVLGVPPDHPTRSGRRLDAQLVVGQPAKGQRRHLQVIHLLRKGAHALGGHVEGRRAQEVAVVPGWESGHRVRAGARARGESVGHGQGWVDEKGWCQAARVVPRHHAVARGEEAGVGEEARDGRGAHQAALARHVRRGQHPDAAPRQRVGHRLRRGQRQSVVDGEIEEIEAVGCIEASSGQIAPRPAAASTATPPPDPPRAPRRRARATWAASTAARARGRPGGGGAVRVMARCGDGRGGASGGG